MRHVGLPVFAVILCRKFAIATVFSWYLPHRSHAAAPDPGEPHQSLQDERREA
jgi:hypothetical protein